MLGPIRVSQIIGSVGSPFRFRTMRQFWSYCGLAVVTRSSDDNRFNDGRLERTKKSVATRGLNHNADELTSKRLPLNDFVGLVE